MRLMLNWYTHFSMGLRIRWLCSLRICKIHSKSGVQEMTLDCLMMMMMIVHFLRSWEWGTPSMPFLPGQVLHYLLGSHLWVKLTCSNIRIRSEYLMLYIVSYNCKLFVVSIVTWTYKCLLRIIVCFLKPYNCKLFALRIVTWNYKCL